MKHHHIHINSHPINSKTLLFLTFVYSIYATCALDITCDSDNTCNDQIISCNPNENCTLYCNNNDICQGATIIGPTDANLTVYCNNGGMHGVCRSMDFIATNSTGLTLYCESKNACVVQATVLCPTHGFCHVYCGSPEIRDLGLWNSIGFCNNMIIDAREMESGELRISSHGQEGYYSMQSSTVYCPGNNLDCMVECGRYGCYSTNIRTQSDTAKLEIDALRIWALKDANIYCPLSGGSASCIINASGAGPEMLTNTHIYTAKGLNQLSLSCNYNTTINECYDALFPPTRILCEDGSGSGCMIELVSEEIDVWQCTDNATINFRCPTLQPTSKPTQVPTKNTVSPTQYPTITPSKNPSVSPTKYPTQNPTITPSKTTTQPTQAPITSVAPTLPPITATDAITTTEIVTTFSHSQLSTKPLIANHSATRHTMTLLDFLIILCCVLFVIVVIALIALLFYRKTHIVTLNPKAPQQNNTDISPHKANDENNTDIFAKSQQIKRALSLSSASNSEDLYNNNIRLQTAGERVEKEIECNTIETSGEGLEGCDVNQFKHMIEAKKALDDVYEDMYGDKHEAEKETTKGSTQSTNYKGANEVKITSTK